MQRLHRSKWISPTTCTFTVERICCRYTWSPKIANWCGSWLFRVKRIWQDSLPFLGTFPAGSKYVEIAYQKVWLRGSYCVSTFTVGLGSFFRNGDSLPWIFFVCQFGTPLRSNWKTGKSWLDSIYVHFLRPSSTILVPIQCSILQLNQYVWFMLVSTHLQFKAWPRS